MRTFIPIMLAAAFATEALAQEKAVVVPTEPKTQLEAMAARSGVVIVRGYTTIGSVHGQKATSVEVAAREFTDASSGKKIYGATVVTMDSGGDPRREQVSYIDYDELDSLSKALDYIVRIDK